MERSSPPTHDTMTMYERSHIFYLLDALESYPMRHKDLLRVAANGSKERSQGYQDIVKRLKKSAASKGLLVAEVRTTRKELMR